jgi:pimeloyl-ACP methyl ester carboxylesterase
MNTFSVNGTRFEYETAGQGEPLLLIHGVIIADAGAPLLSETALTSRFRVTHYHRRGFAGSQPHAGPFSIEEQAADALAVLHHVAGDRAHVLGHSYGGSIAVQLALAAPASVHSLSLLEAGLPRAAAHVAPGSGEALALIRAAYASGDRAGAVDGFLRLAIGVDYRGDLDRTLRKGWFEQSVADLDTLYQVEAPALVPWHFDASLAQGISQPVFLVAGANSPPSRLEDLQLLQAWFPDAEVLVLPGASHALQMQNPGGMAEALAAFLTNHPMAVPAGA